MGLHQYGGPSVAKQVADLLRKPLRPDPYWIGPGFLPRRNKCLFGGAFATGKSFVALNMAHSLVTGVPLFGHPGFAVKGQPRVLLVDQELGDGFDLHDRMLKMFSSVPEALVRDRFMYVSCDYRFKLDTDEGYAILRYEIERWKPNVVILDPATKLMVGSDADNECVARFWLATDRLIKEFGEELDLSFAVSHHFRKPDSQARKLGLDDPLDFYNVRGGAKWLDDPSTRVVLYRPDEKKDPVVKATGGEAWTVYMRLRYRSAKSPQDDYKLIVNEKGDGMIRMVGAAKHLGEGLKPAAPREKKVHVINMTKI